MYKFLLSLVFIISASAKTYKISTLAPEGTTWAKNLQLVAQDVKKATNGEVKFKFFFGGTQGDEPDVLRKIRIGQLHGAIFTGRALGDIYSDIRMLEVPFNFKKGRSQFQKALKGLDQYLTTGMKSNGFKNLGFFEIGNIYLVSLVKVTSLNDLKGVKIWAWDGDKVAESLVKQLNLVAVPLALPDVLSSLQSGVLQAAYNSPMGIIALQWSTKIQYLLDFPIAYAVGSFVLSNKAWDSIPQKYHKEISSITSKYLKINSDETIAENKESLEALKTLGVKFIHFPESELSVSGPINQKLIIDLKANKVISDKVIGLFKKALAK